MRIILHDYGRHAFPVQLSRSLVARGHTVLHLYAGYNNTPMGNLNRKETDPPAFLCEALYTKEPLQKYNFVKRWFQENEYKRLLGKRILDFQPEVIISATGPTDAHITALQSSRQINARFIFWLQDINGIAAEKVLRKKIPLIGNLIGYYFLYQEKSLLRSSDAIILISRDFLPVIEKWGVQTRKTHIIPNWAPIENIPVRPKANQWALDHGVADKFCFLYTGSLGLKHNPDFFLQLALKYCGDDHVRIMVVSEGLGASWLSQKKQEYQLNNLILLNYQAFEALPDMLGAGDVLLGVLHPDAGLFSVPSKTTTYVCAKRPLLMAISPENMAAKMIVSNQAGMVVPPDDMQAFLTAADFLYNHPEQCVSYAKNAREYAENHFDIERITDQFENVLI